MTEVTYFVALPFVAADDGIAAGEPTECFNPTAVVMRAEALSRKPGHVGADQPNASTLSRWSSVGSRPPESTGCTRPGAVRAGSRSGVSAGRVAMASRRRAGRGE